MISLELTNVLDIYIVSFYVETQRFRSCLKFLYQAMIGTFCTECVPLPADGSKISLRNVFFYFTKPER
jgi:hypothetical protein